ncbi:NAC domain-containing protein 21 [Musa troglodytarum]|uniref:NAC domain-containing protein 21 n=1 Tax=Musa troglodytarum TaxID=320322 RepID=A0A9E7HCE8_9LILI|nr:NAC domain-containing protein 21 [Musa troglodytarum]
MNTTMSMLSMVEAKLPPGFRFHPRDDELVCDYLAAKAAGGSTESSSLMMVAVDLNKCEPWDLPEFHGLYSCCSCLSEVNQNPEGELFSLLKPEIIACHLLQNHVAEEFITLVLSNLYHGVRFDDNDDKVMKPVNSSVSTEVDCFRGSAAACVGGNEWYLFSLRDLKYATGQRTNLATMSGYWKATGKDKPVTRKGLLVGMRKTLVFYQGRAPKGKKTEWVMHEFRMEGSDGAPKLPFQCMQQDWVLCRVFCNNRRISTMPSMEASHENSGSQSLSALMDNCITFGQTPFYSEGFEQVPCFSSLSPSYVSQCQDIVLTKCLAQTVGLPELNSGDRRASRTVMNHLTRFEGDPKGKMVPQGGFEDYLTQSRLPSTWNP